MGTPEFAARSLGRLYEDGHEIAGVFTQPDKPRNRGMQLQESPVKALALARGAQVFQPKTLKDGEAAVRIRGLAPEIIVVVAYGKILPPSVLEIPPLGCVNVHGSILPKYRGAAPIQRAVLSGDRETGVTVMYMAEELDAGDIISVRRTPIGPAETSGALFDRMMDLGAKLLGETLPEIAAGQAERTPQDETAATFAPPLQKSEAPIDWARPPAEIHNHVRGLIPWPVATAELDGKVFKVFKVKPETREGTPGEILSAGDDGILVACLEGSVLIEELQAPGKKRMRAGDYLRGNPLHSR